MSNKQVLYLSIFTLLTVVAWIVFDLFHATTTSTITPIQEKLIAPLNPTFETEIISRLKGGG